MQPHKEQALRIKQKLIQAKNAVNSEKVFGADKHQYKIGSTVTQEDISRFEQKYGIALPCCLASFYLFVGNGGHSESYLNADAGPFYGIYPLGESADELVDEPEIYLQRECMLYPGMSTQEWEQLNKSIEQLPDPEADAALQILFSGVLPLGPQGCTYLHGIVLTGPYRGRVVNIEACRFGVPLFTWEDNFLDWYERWLDEVIAGHLQHPAHKAWFGYYKGGTEEVLLAQFLEIQNPDEQGECLPGLLYKSKLTAQSVSIIEQLIIDEHPLKAALLEVLCKHDYEKAKPHLQQLAPTDLKTVAECIFRYAAEYSSEWVPTIKQNIETVTDAGAFRYCTYVLKEANVPVSRVVASFTKSENEEIRKHAIYVMDSPEYNGVSIPQRSMLPFPKQESGGGFAGQFRKWINSLWKY